jgi:hypothetical protein
LFEIRAKKMSRSPTNGMLGFDMKGFRETREAHPNQSAPAERRVHIPALKSTATRIIVPRKSWIDCGLEMIKSGFGKKPCDGRIVGSGRAPWPEKSSPACGMSVRK